MNQMRQRLLIAGLILFGIAFLAEGFTAHGAERSLAYGLAVLFFLLVQSAERVSKLEKEIGKLRSGRSG